MFLALFFKCELIQSRLNHPRPELSPKTPKNNLASPGNFRIVPGSEALHNLTQEHQESMPHIPGTAPFCRANPISEAQTGDKPLKASFN